jgi:hypothetical protein
MYNKMTELINVRAGVFVACLTLFAASLETSTAHAQPHIEQVTGPVEEGGTLIISGDNFTSKAHDMPLLVWRAEDGELPNEELGRAAEWDGGDSFAGEIGSTVTAPGSTASARYDHGASTGKALAWVGFDTARVYVFRTVYEDFDGTEDYAVRTRFRDLEGDVMVGQKVVGQTSGATGYVGIYSPPSEPGGRGDIQYEKGRGSIYDDPSVDFEYGETMTTDTGTMVNREGSSEYPTGTYRTFNFKTMRFWNDEYRNNMYFGGTEEFKMTPEYTGSSVWSDLWQNVKAQTPRVWQNEEVVLDTGSVDEDDAVIRIRTDGVLNLDTTFSARDSERPGRYDRIAQSQFSNGAQPGTYMYYDMLYVDDSWHRVILCAAPQYTDCEHPEVQFVQGWDGDDADAGEVRFMLRRGWHTNAETAYLYLVNGNDEVNPEGYPISFEATSPDAGTPTTPDAGSPTTPDAGSPNTPDTGTSMTPDTGLESDAGRASNAESSAESDGGCSVANGSRPGLPLAIVFAAMGLLAVRCRRCAAP